VRFTLRAMIYLYLMRLSPVDYYVIRWKFFDEDHSVKPKRTARKRRAWRLQEHFRKQRQIFETGFYNPHRKIYKKSTRSVSAENH